MHQFPHDDDPAELDAREAEEARAEDEAMADAETMARREWDAWCDYQRNPTPAREAAWNRAHCAWLRAMALRATMLRVLCRRAREAGL